MSAVTGAGEQQTIEIGVWQLDIKTRTLCDGNESKTLDPTLFQILYFLIENKGNIVTRQELSLYVWQQEEMDNSVINRAIFDLRKALSSPKQSSELIKTHYRKGYSLAIDTTAKQKQPVEQQSSLNANKKNKHKWALTLISLCILLLLGSVYSWYDFQLAPTQPDIVTPSPAQLEVELTPQPFSWVRGLHTFMQLTPDSKQVAYSIYPQLISEGEIGQVRMVSLDSQQDIELNIPGEGRVLGWDASGKILYSRNYVLMPNRDIKTCEYMRTRLEPATNPISETLFACDETKVISNIFSFNEDQLIYSKPYIEGLEELLAIHKYDVKTKSEIRLTTPGSAGEGDSLINILPETQQVLFERVNLTNYQLMLTSKSGHNLITLAETDYRIWVAVHHQPSNSILWYNRKQQTIERVSLTTLERLPSIKAPIQESSYVFPLSKDQLLTATYPFYNDSYSFDIKNKRIDAFARPAINETDLFYIGDNQYLFNDDTFVDNSEALVQRIIKGVYSGSVAALKGYEVLDVDIKNSHILVQNKVDHSLRLIDLTTFDTISHFPQSYMISSARINNELAIIVSENKMTGASELQLLHMPEQKLQEITGISHVSQADWLNNEEIVILTLEGKLYTYNALTKQITEVSSFPLMQASITRSLRLTLAAGDDHFYTLSSNTIYQWSKNAPNELTKVLEMEDVDKAPGYFFGLTYQEGKLLFSVLHRKENHLVLYTHQE
ncbi:winged helix-turn-helix domain-containing protein [Pseudoalteromonas sp. T1lg65]|uniref:winged helix-turn-helix domain-containing protein n=1 Tax=Pseudoalteromonas sp. T1lg65 TaxID=2077101 RepID=UPI003F7A1000